MNGSAGSESPLGVVRRLYRAWNAGDVAGAAELLAPGVRWESFGASPPEDGMQATLAAGSSHGTWMLSPGTVDLLVCVVDHVIAFTRRAEAEAERIEVWTLRDGRAVHYRGYPLDEGLAVLSETTGSRRLEAVCRGVLGFNRGDVEGWVRELGALCPGQRLDDVRILAETADALVVSALDDLDERLNLVVAFEGDRAWRVTRHATPEEALAAA
jgi:ketosteroid isomerase-like protein